MGRTDKSIKNIYVAFIGQFLGIIISFISRSLFIKYLNAEYLGINGLFTNILQMLSLVELGIGPAIIYALYKPLAEHDEKKIASIMRLYKKTYTIIGIIIILLGIIITPFITLFVEDIPSVSQNIYVIFLLFVFNSGISYFFSYKRNLIIADQKRYIATIYRYVIYFFLNFFQIIILYLTANYYLYLIMQIIFTLLENILINIKANKLYPFLTKNAGERLDIETRNKILKNTKATVFHKVGGLVVNSTDNLLLSKLINVTVVGVYSNYFLITNALNTIISQIFSSVTASVGNLNVSESKEKSLIVFNRLNFINFLIISVCSVTFCCTVNDFIKAWLGEKYLFDFDLIIVITICFYLNGMRKSVLTFKDAFGLYWEDRFKPVAEVIINLVVSICLGLKIGTIGIFLGTIISNVLTCLWIEPYVLYKHGFHEKCTSYFITYLKYLLLTLCFAVVAYLLCLPIGFAGFKSFVIKSIVSILLVLVLIMLLFRKSKEYIYVKNIIYSTKEHILKKLIKK